MTKQLVVLLHGFGTRGADMAGLAQAWQAQLPDAGFAMPDAPELTSFGAGYQWFSLQGVDADNRPERIVAARAAFDACLQQVFVKQGIDPYQDAVVLVGFSQGAIMALDLLVSQRWPVAGVVAFSGRLASPPPWARAAETPVLLIHGRQDEVISWQEAASAQQQLQAVGYPVAMQIEEGNGHGISPAGSRLAADFIRAQLALLAPR